jgi:catechol 2,3-dioxygenase-like lactoylglutathione lyase family enzyme
VSTRGSGHGIRALAQLYLFRMRVRPQPLLAVKDVERASRWYQRVLGAQSGHGGNEYEQLLVDDAMVLQLHALEVAHHHGAIGDPGSPVGNGVAVWFETDDFDAVVRRSREVNAEVVTDVHANPNARRREIWLRDLDGYLVVFAEAD